MLKFSPEPYSFKLGTKLKELVYNINTPETRASNYRGDTFELDSVQSIYDQDTKPNKSKIVKFFNSRIAKIVNAGKISI